MNGILGESQDGVSNTAWGKVTRNKIFSRMN